MNAAVRRRQRWPGEAGYSLVELVTVLVLLGIVTAALATIFVSGSQAGASQSARIQAQQDARLALDGLRADAHCGTTASPAGSSAVVRIDVPAGCVSGVTSYVVWCTAAVGGSGNRYALWRIPDSAGNSSVPPAASCPTGDAGAVRYADYLTTGSVFAYTAGSGVVGHEQLPTLAVDLPVDVNAASALRSPPAGWELRDTLVLSNGART